MFPFGEKVRSVVFDLNQKCQVNFQCFTKRKNCELAVDLAQKMMEANPLKRISAKEALKHPFFQINDKEINKPLYNMNVTSKDLIDSRSTDTMSNYFTFGSLKS